MLENHNAPRRKRPERKLYVPPAQRKSRLHDRELIDGTTYVENLPTLDLSKNLEKNGIMATKTAKYKKSDLNENLVALNQSCDDVAVQNICDKSCSTLLKCSDTFDIVDHFELGLEDVFSLLLSQSKLPLKINYKIGPNLLSLYNLHELFCEFYEYLSKNYNISDFNISVPIYSNCSHTVLYIPTDDCLCWQPHIEYISPDVKTNMNFVAFPILNFKINLVESGITFDTFSSAAQLTLLYKMTHSICESCKHFGVLQIDVKEDLKNDSDIIFNEYFVWSDVLKVKCDSELLENVFDLTKFEMGHYFENNGSEYFHSFEDYHNIAECYLDVQTNSEIEDVNNMFNLNEYKQEIQTAPRMSLSADQTPSPPPVDQTNITNNKVTSSGFKQESGNVLLITKNMNELECRTNISSKKNEHEEEKEIMRKAKENINRKTRPLMKYVEDSDDLLKIDNKDNVNNWEDLFDDDGQIQEELLSEIVQRVGKNATIVKAAEDYSAYTIKPKEDLEHIVELYNFPSTLGTADLIHAFSELDSDSMYIKWVDETHALLVLGSSIQAQRAVKLDSPMIKVRPITSASSSSITVATTSDLRPAMKRPPTNLQTARRLITSHLGTKTKVTKEQNAKEKELLRNARELRKLTKQNEKDAWEGNIRSSTK